jgi:hypothetical protein
MAMAALTVGLALSLWGAGVGVYYATAFVLGLYLVSDRLALFNLSMAFSPHDDNTAYIGAIPAITAPALAVVAGAAGPAIDIFGYIAVGWVSLAAAAVSLYLVAFRLPEPPYSLAGKQKAA